MLVCWIGPGSSAQSAPSLDQLRHLLVAGATGSGKTNFVLRSLLWQLTHLYGPSEVDLVLIDGKGVADFIDYEGAPHFKAPEDFHLGAAGALDLFDDIVNRRVPERSAVLRKQAASALKRKEPVKITDLRRLLEDSDRRGVEPLLVPLVVIVDEFTELVLSTPDRKRFEELVARFNATARAVGGHLIVATQRPSVDVVSGLIKANFGRLSLQVKQDVDSRVILGQGGAESLLGSGDLLFGSDEGLVRLQGYAAYDAVSFW